MINKIYHSCSCIFEFIQQVEEEIKCEASLTSCLTFYLFSSTHLINLIKHEHSCKILYVIHLTQIRRCMVEHLKFPFSLNFQFKSENSHHSLISRTDKVELIATEFFQQSCHCLGYLEQHTKSCKSYLVGKYIYFLLKNYHFYV